MESHKKARFTRFYPIGDDGDKLRAVLETKIYECEQGKSIEIHYDFRRISNYHQSKKQPLILFYLHTFTHYSKQLKAKKFPMILYIFSGF